MHTIFWLAFGLLGLWTIAYPTFYRNRNGTRYPYALLSIPGGIALYELALLNLSVYSVPWRSMGFTVFGSYILPVVTLFLVNFIFPSEYGD